MADLPDDPVTYYSDDEMVMKRKGAHFGGLRNKKGHPIYSREDIREQYCINRKELQVFEDNIYHQRGLFGCLSTSHLPDNSPCNKNSYLFSCMQKGKCTGDLEPDDLTSKNQGKSDYREDEDEDSDGGFKRRPKPRTCALLEQKNSWPGRGDHLAQNIRAIERFPISMKSSAHVAQPCDVHYVSSYRLNYKQIVQNSRPSLLKLNSSKEVQSFSSTSKATGELSGDQWAVRAPVLRSRTVKTPDSLEQSEERTKHVSFNCSTLVRSNTVASGLETPCDSSHDHRYSIGGTSNRSDELMSCSAKQLSPEQSSVSTSYGSQGFSSSSTNLCKQSQERLITGSFRSVDKSELNGKNLDHGSLINQSFPCHSAQQQLYSSYLYLPATTASQSTMQHHLPIYHPSTQQQLFQHQQQPLGFGGFSGQQQQSQIRSMRRVVMKTHATQTETASSSATAIPPYDSTIPDYLTLSPRASGSRSPGNDESGIYDPHNQSQKYYNSHNTKRDTIKSSHPHQQNIHYQQHRHYHHHHPLRGVSHQDNQRIIRNITPDDSEAKEKGQQKKSSRVSMGYSDDDGRDEVMEIDVKEDKSRKASRINYVKGKKYVLEEERQTKVRTRVRMKYQRSLSTSQDDDGSDQDNHHHRHLSSNHSAQSCQATYKSEGSLYNQQQQPSQLQHQTVSKTECMSTTIPNTCNFRSQSHNHLENDADNDMTSDYGIRYDDSGLYRRHSVAADFLTDMPTPLLYPPPGFEDRQSPNEDKTVENPEHGLRKPGSQASEDRCSLRFPSSSSSSSSKALASGDGTDDGNNSITEMDDMESSLPSQDSPTLISELSSALISPPEDKIIEVKDQLMRIEQLQQKQQQQSRKGRKLAQKSQSFSNSKSEATNNPESKVTDTNEPINYQRVNGSRVIKPSKSPVSEQSSHQGDLVSPKSELLSTDFSLADKNGQTADIADGDGDAAKLPVDRKTSGSGSSVYITASECSNKDEEGIDGDNMNMASIDSREKSVNSFETASSSNTVPSQFSSPSSSSFRIRRSSKSGGSTEDIDDTATSPDMIGTEIKVHLSPGDFQFKRKNGSYSPKSSRERLSESYDTVRSESSEPEVDGNRKEAMESPISESLASKLSDHYTEEFDSECHGSSDLTPTIYEAVSSDPSTAFDVATVVEINKTKVSPVQTKEAIEEEEVELGESVENAASGDDILGEKRKDSTEQASEASKTSENEGSIDAQETTTASVVEAGDSEGDPVESDDLEAYAVDDKDTFALTALDIFCRRTLSGELSTVSEVSEEISNIKSGELSPTSSSSAPGLRESSEATLNKEKSEKKGGVSPGQDDEAGLVGSVEDKDGRDQTEASSPSSFSDSTTSGSFLIDAQASEPNSVNEDIKLVSEETRDQPEIASSDTADLTDNNADDNKISQTGSLPCYGTEGGKSVKSAKKVVLSEGASIIESFGVAVERHATDKNDVASGQLGSEKSSKAREAEEREEEDRRCMDTAGESSQATEHDMARLEFSLTQQSSQEIDEESLSMATHMATLHGEKTIDEDDDDDDDDNDDDGAESQHNDDPAIDRPETPTTTTEATTPITNNNNNNNNNNDNNILKEEQNSVEFIKTKPDNIEGNPIQTKEVLVQQAKSDEVENPEKIDTKRQCDHNLPNQSSNGQRRGSSERRTRSLTRSPGKSLSPAPLCTHQFTCSQCGEASHQNNSQTHHHHQHQHQQTQQQQQQQQQQPKKSREVGSKVPYPYRKSATIEDILSYRKDDDEDIGVYSDAYKSCSWLYIGRRDELRVWGQRHLDKIEPKLSLDASKVNGSMERSDSMESTNSEKGFKKHYEAVTHRMIHRKASIEMYKKILENTFTVEKCVTVARNNGEFGFRIHGSRPVVVSAIEKGTPAESCGLEVGDIIVSVNDTNVLDASHSEIVRLAHAGSETLKLELVRTCQKLKTALKEMKDDDEIFSGYLHRKSTSLAAGNTLTEKETWKKRWFILRPDCCLYWYNQPKAIDPLGVINLQNCTITLIPSASTNTSDVRCVIRIDRIEGPSSYLYTNLEENAQRWLQHLTSAANKISRTNFYVEKTLRCIHIKPLAIKDYDCRGYLGIFGQKRKLWKQRYFVLKDACLYSYIDITSSIALSVFYLHGCKVQSATLVGKRSTFEIVPWDRKMKHLWLMAESEIDKKRWLAALEYSIDRWIKLS